MRLTTLFATIITAVTIATLIYLWIFVSVAPKVKVCALLGGEYNAFLGECSDRTGKEIRIK